MQKGNTGGITLKKEGKREDYGTFGKERETERGTDGVFIFGCKGNGDRHCWVRGSRSLVRMKGHRRGKFGQFGRGPDRKKLIMHRFKNILVGESILGRLERQRKYVEKPKGIRKGPTCSKKETKIGRPSE